MVTNNRFDFKANLLNTTRRLATDYHVEPKWNAPANDITDLTSPTAIQAKAEALLEPPASDHRTALTVVTTYDALNRVTSRTTPDGSVTTPTYNAAGLLETLAVAVGNGPSRTVVANIDYNARGQRMLYKYADPTVPAGPTGSAVTCKIVYKYDPFTFRLTKITTRRVSDNVLLQDLDYTFDPVGNIVQLDDGGVFATTVPVSESLYVYDAVYRLIRATGREHPGQVGAQIGPGDADPIGIPNPNDLQALVSYSETYAYDPVGNIERLTHTAAAGAAQWTRRYKYATDSNRLLATSRAGDAPDAFSDSYEPYTSHGSMQRMPHLLAIDWDYADRMQHASRGLSDDVFFTYDAAGQRVRKVWQHNSGSIDERIYVGGWETFRTRAATPGAPITFERETLHVMDDTRRVAMVETRITDTTQGPSGPLWRLQLDNHLGSSLLELSAAANIISYEEYHPFGSTAFRAADSSEVSAKRYRCTGKEKDEETGLYYHGARYYVPWLGRWTAADPAGMVDGTNLYRYARNNPNVMADPTGKQSAPQIVPTVTTTAVAVAKKTAAERAALQWAAKAAATTTAEVAAPAAAPAAGAGALAGVAVGQAAAQGLALYLATKLYMQRAGGIARYGNPLGMPSEYIAFPVIGVIRNRQAAPDLETAPSPEPAVEPVPKEKEEDKKPKRGRIYVTYTKFNEKTGLYYSGRTSMVIDLNLPLRPQALAAVEARDQNHHIEDENLEPNNPGFKKAELESFDVGTAVNYANRYEDVAYRAIRGREQQLIDLYGGAQSDTKPGPHRTENAVRGVAKDNPFGKIFHKAANDRFKQELHPYTGY